MKRVKKTFTLIELLVVIAIIAILAAMLLPTLSKAKDKSITSNCLSQLKQVGGFISLYNADFTGYYPPLALTNTYGSNLWAQALTELYFSGKEFNDCLKTFSCPTKVSPYTQYNNKWGITYGMNAYFCTKDSSSETFNGYEQSNPRLWKQPSLTIMNADNWYPDMHYVEYIVAPDRSSAKDYKWGHNGAKGINVLFMDGHGAFVSTNGLTGSAGRVFFNDYYMWYDKKISQGPW